MFGQGSQPSDQPVDATGQPVPPQPPEPVGLFGTLEQRLTRIEQHLGLNRNFVQDSEQPGA